MSLYDAYLEFIQAKSLYCSDITVRYYAGNVMRFLVFLGNYTTFPVEQLTKKEVSAYVAMLREQSCKNVSVNTYFRAVRTFCSWLWQNQYTNSNLSVGMRFLKSDPSNVIPVYQDEANRIDQSFDCSQELGLRNYCLFHLMLDLGMRRGEVISYSKKNLIVEKNLLSVLGKGNKYRIIPVPAWLMEQLLNYHQLGHETFVRRYGGQITDNTVKQLFQGLKSSTGIQRLHPHLLRHTFATSYMIGGGNLEYLRLLMGHTDYDVTRNYLHLANQFQLLGADIYKLDEIFFRKGY